MKKILITGCGSGLGRKASFALANRGHYVYATTHTEEQANEINSFNKNITFLLKALNWIF